MKTDISRRGFLKGASFLAGTAAVAGLAGCASDQGTAASAPAEETAAETGAATGGDTRPEKNTNTHPQQIDINKADAQPIDPIDVPASWDGEFDVIVVGTGMGGLTAALYCAQQGASVLAIEKDAETGGASRHACFNQINYGGSQAQNDMGYYYPTQDATGNPIDGFNAKEAAADWENHLQFSVEPKILVRSIEEGGKWADWMQEVPGMSWVPFAGGWCFVDSAVADGTQNFVLANDRTINSLTDECVAQGVDLRVSTEMTGLVYDGERVQGIQIKSGECFKAAQGVILCAGGMGFNLDMLEKWVPSGYMYATNGGPVTSHTGEAIRMAQGIGADMSGYNSFSSWDGSLDEYWGDGDGNYWHFLFSPSRDIFCNPFLQLDACGNRLPQIGGQPNMYKPAFGGGAGICTIFASPDHRKRVVLDSHFLEYVEEYATSIYGGNDRVCPTTFYQRTSEAGKVYMPVLDFDQDWQDHIDRGSVVQADTLEELAEKLHMDPADLQRGVDEWNAMCEAGEDTEMIFAQNPATLKPIKDAPFYGAVVGGQISKTMCGLRINDKMQVLNTDHKVIDGLYAGWSTAGGICGENMLEGTWGNCSPFGSVGFSGVGGWLCGKAIMGEFE